MRIQKWTLITGIACFGIIFGLAGLIYFVQPAIPLPFASGYSKARFEQTITALLSGRPAAVRGNFSLVLTFRGLHPVIAVAAKDVAIANVPGDQEMSFAAIGEVDMQIDASVLTNKSAQPTGSFILISPNINVEIDSKGRWNVPRFSRPNRSSNFEQGNDTFEIRDGSINYRAYGRSQSLSAIRGLDLTMKLDDAGLTGSGQFSSDYNPSSQSGKFDFSNCNASNGTLSSDCTATGHLALDLNTELLRNTLGYFGFAMPHKGPARWALTGDFSYEDSVPTLTSLDARGAFLSGEGNADSAQPSIPSGDSCASVTNSPGAPGCAILHLSQFELKDCHEITSLPDCKVDGSLSLTTNSIRDFVSYLGVPTPRGTGLGYFSVTGNLSYSADVIAFAIDGKHPLQLDSAGDCSNGGCIAGKLKLILNRPFETGRAPLTLTGDLQVDNFDLSPYLGGAITNSQSSPYWDTTPISANVLTTFRYIHLDNLAFQAKALKIRSFVIDDIHAQISSREDGNDQVDASIDTLRAYHGEAIHPGTFQAWLENSIPHFFLKVTIANADLHSLLKDAAGVDSVTGIGDLDLENMTASGSSPAEIMQSLHGNGTFELDNGLIDGLGVIKGEKALSFTSFQGEFRIQNGDLKIDKDRPVNLVAKSSTQFQPFGSEIALQLNGDLDIGRKCFSLDYRPRDIIDRALLWLTGGGHLAGSWAAPVAALPVADHVCVPHGLDAPTPAPL